MKTPSEQCWALHNARIKTGDRVVLIAHRSTKGTVLEVGPASLTSRIQWDNPEIGRTTERINHINKI